MSGIFSKPKLPPLLPGPPTFDNVRDKLDLSRKFNRRKGGLGNILTGGIMPGMQATKALLGSGE